MLKHFVKGFEFLRKRKTKCTRRTHMCTPGTLFVCSGSF